MTAARAICVAFAGALASVIPDCARAQGQFDATYTLSMAGISVGQLDWRASIGAASYSSSVVGRARGLVRMLLNVEGKASVRGSIRNGQAWPALFMSAATSDLGASSVQMTLQTGNVSDLDVVEPPHESDHLPITDAHKSGVADPLSALLIPAAAGDPLQASACERSMQIFDGRRRFDLTLTYRRMAEAKPDRGYQGKALVCSVVFQPIAGHRTSSPLVRFATGSREIEVWFVPIAGTNMLAPIRLHVASALGNMVLRADTFETSASAGAGAGRI